MLSLLFLACTSGTLVLDKAGVGDDTGGASDSGNVNQPATPSVTISGDAVLDPILGGPAEFVVETKHVDFDLRAVIQDSAGVEVGSLAEGAVPAALSWTGRDEAGASLPAGNYSLVITAAETGEEMARQPIALVRLGLTDGTLGGDRIAVIWYDAGGSPWDNGTDEVTFALSDLLDADGEAASIPSVWEDLDEPPEELVDVNLPSAYPYDSHPTLSLTVGGDIADAAVGLSATIDGWTLSSGAVNPGDTLVFVRDAELSEGLGVIDETLQLHWLADGVELGSQEIPLRLYSVLGPPTFDSDESPYLPWLSVIDPALRAIDGVEPDADAVISGLVDHIYHDLGLSYDTNYGASYYVSYGWGYDSASTNMSNFVQRTRGSIVNCSDCAGILSTYANMLGAPLDYAIIDPRFDLNYIKAIGGSSYTSCPFGSGRCSFSYHAVTTPDDTETIFDATLALDGDDDPSNTPNEELLVQQVSGEDYLDRLVRSGTPRYSVYGTGEIR